MPHYDPVRLALRHGAPILACALVGALAAGGLAALTPSTYASSTSLFLTSPSSANAGGVYERSLFAQGRLTSYLPLATSPVVLSPVITSLGLDVTPRELADDVEVRSVPDSVLLTIEARAGTPQEAQAIAGATAARFSMVVEGLEAGNPTAASSVKFGVVHPAALETTPVAPRPVRSAVTGLVLGLLIGLALAVLRERFGRRTATPDDVAEIPGLRLLGTVGHDDQARRHPLLVGPRHRSRRLEEFRALRERLPGDGLGRGVFVTSPTRGDGRTSTALNLALVLAEEGAQVVVVDLDVGRPSVGRVLHLPEVDPPAGLAQVLDGRVDLAYAQQSWESGVLRVLLPGAEPTAHGVRPLPVADVRLVLSKLFDQADVVVVDCPPLLEAPETVSLVLGGVTLLVARAGRTTRSDLEVCVARLHDAGVTDVGAVLNGHRTYGRERPGRPLGLDLSGDDAGPPAHRALRLTSQRPGRARVVRPSAVGTGRSPTGAGPIDRNLAG